MARKKRKHLRGWVKTLICLCILFPAMFFTFRMYIKASPYFSIRLNAQPETTVRYNAVKNYFYTDDIKRLTNTELSVRKYFQKEQTIRLDENGNLYTGWYQDANGSSFYYTKENGYLKTGSGKIQGVTIAFASDGHLLHKEWYDDCWYENGERIGLNRDTLLFIQGERGFYYLSVSLEGRKVVNSSRTLADQREVRFDETGKLIQSDIFTSSPLYCPVPETFEIANDTYTIPVSDYFKQNETSFAWVSHRGFHEVCPENNLLAYKEAVKKGYLYLETDVQFTKDQVPVLLHNDTVNAVAALKDGSRYTSGHYINTLNYSDLSKYTFAKNASDAPVPITTFEQFIAFCKAENVIPYIEMKDETVKTQEQVHQLYQIVCQYHMEDSAVWISFSPQLLTYILIENPNARLGLVEHNRTDADFIRSEAKSLKNAGANLFIDAYYKKQDEYLAFCKENSIDLEVWGVNTKEVYDTISSDVRAITTDTLGGTK